MAKIMKNIGRALAGFGAGVQGRGGLYMAEQNRQDRILEHDRQQALVEDLYGVQQSLTNGDPNAALKRLQSRRENIMRLGGDTANTDDLIMRINSGDIKGAFNEVSTVVNTAVGSGRFRLPQAAKPNIQGGFQYKTDANGNVTAHAIPGYTKAGKSQIVNGQVVNIGPQGKATATDIEGFKPDPGKGIDRHLKQQQLDISRRAEDRQANKLSAGLEKVLLTSQDNIVKSQGAGSMYENLANEFASRAGELQSGVQMTFSEGLKGILGTQDDVTELRRMANQARISVAMDNLPPGVASDKDVELAFKGVPRENASPEQVSSWLRGMSKIEKAKAAYNQMKSEYISKTRGGSGLNQAWRKSVNAPALGRNVTVSEIYSTAQNRGMTPEDVMKKFGIDKELF